MQVIGFILIAALCLVAYVMHQKANQSSASTDPKELAKVHIAYGRKDKARALLQSHLQSNPGDREAQSLLDTLS